MDKAVTAVAGAAQAAEGIDRVDIRVVNRPGQRSLYRKREKVTPKLAHGTFRRVKWVAMALTLAVYYLAPWLRWERGDTLPDQAILIDFPARRFYFFFLEIWPQEVYYLTGLLILAALILFLVTSLAGRVWCGYACPQTVWTDLFITVERLIEGDRNVRLRLDQAKWTLDKIAKKAVKHASWLAIAILTGGAWVFYFADAPTLFVDLFALDAPAITYIFIAVFTFTTYALGGHAREQVCTYMCPWPRIQAALQDEYSLTVSYHAERGELRGPHKKGEPWDGRGHCIDCNQCVAVCPAGIDIREGQQLPCISCALCVDACNGVMDKVGLPRGLISYDTLENLDQGATAKTKRYRLVRPRTVVYAALIVVVGLVMLAGVATRSDLEVTVQRDRNPVFVTLSDGRIRNGYTIKALNKSYDVRELALSIEGLSNAELAAVGIETVAGVLRMHVAPDKLRSVRVYVTAPRSALAGESTPIAFMLQDTKTGKGAHYDGVFRGPIR